MNNMDKLGRIQDIITFELGALILIVKNDMGSGKATDLGKCYEMKGDKMREVPKGVSFFDYVVKGFGSVGYFLLHFNGTESENAFANKLFDLELRRKVDGLRYNLSWQCLYHPQERSSYEVLRSFLQQFQGLHRDDRGVQLKYNGREITERDLLLEVRALL